MAPSILKITAATSVRSISRYLNSCRGARIISTVNKSDKSRTSSVESRISCLSSSYPWLMLSPRSCNTSYELYSFAEKRVLSIPKPDLKYEVESGFRDATKILGSSHGWLACFNRRRRELFLLNPLSGRRVNLPPFHNLSTPESKLSDGKRLIVKKIIITCSDPESEDCQTVMIFGMADRLAICCPGRSSPEWTLIGQSKCYLDVVYWFKHELFFSLTYISRLDAWDLRNPLSPSLVWSCHFDDLEEEFDNGGEPSLSDSDVTERKYSQKRKYPVVSKQGELYLVQRYINCWMMPDGSCAPDDDDSDDDMENNNLRDPSKTIMENNNLRYPSKTVDFNVYKIVVDGDRRKKVLMGGHLDGLVMFIGDPSHVIAIPADEANGFQPNSICFTEDDHGFFSSHHGTDNGIFDYKKKTFSSCYYPIDYERLKNKMCPPPLWITPN
ncbi:hypothetical protein CASFOL_008917 [Castilleja foliolosa]|uniref:KIB1-4 beta-propeller domain-containing protein n=1 Tax=Castilleja foliolosa TaxID=1961234 RepID=A0ABD3E4F3_9LAMI